MGDCASRPTTGELEQHIRDYNSKHDIHFRSVPFDSKIETAILGETSKKALTEKLKLFKRKNTEYNALFEAVTGGIPAIPELSIEIQKGLHLHTNSVCFAQGKPYVSIQLEPKGPIFETFESDIYMPY